MENPIQISFKNKGDFQGHITEKARGVVRFKADLVQGFSDAVSLQGPISFPLSVLPLPQGWLPSWCQNGHRSSRLCISLPCCPRERPPLLVPLSDEEEISLICPRQLTVESTWVCCVTSSSLNHYSDYLRGNRTHPKQMSHSGKG